MTAPHGTAPEYEQAQIEEWSRYRARVPIDYYGVRAYNVGDPVPQSAVGDDPDDGRWINPEWVDEVGSGGQTYEGSQTVPPPEPPTIDPATVAAPPGAA